MAAGVRRVQAREMWQLVETIHAVVYFAPEHRRAMDAAGTRGGWMAYFASRSAPLGATSAEVVTAAFYNFAPAMVRRAIPDAWELTTPEAVLAARRGAVREALVRLLGNRFDPAALDEAVALLEDAASAEELGGRVLFAANAALTRPTDPLERLWHATTMLREHRGDGHVAALLHAGIDGCQAHILAAAAGRNREDQLRPNRGWSDAQWAEAAARLVDRGLLEKQGPCTAAGHALHAGIERETDRLAAPPWQHLGLERTNRVAGLLRPIADAVVASGVLPFPNAMGLPARDSSS